MLPCQHQTGRTARTHWLSCEEPLDMSTGHDYPNSNEVGAERGSRTPTPLRGTVFESWADC